MCALLRTCFALLRSFALFRVFLHPVVSRTTAFGNFNVCVSWLLTLEPQTVLKFRRVTIRGAQPSARLSEEICLSEGSAGVSERAPRGLSEGSAGSLRGSAGVREIFRGFRG